MRPDSAASSSHTRLVRQAATPQRLGGPQAPPSRRAPQQGAPFGLVRLPAELITHVLTHLDPLALFGVARVNHPLRQLCQLPAVTKRVLGPARAYEETQLGSAPATAAARWQQVVAKAYQNIFETQAPFQPVLRLESKVGHERVQLSTNGRWLLASEGAALAQLFDLARNGKAVTLEGNHATLSPDSRFVCSFAARSRCVTLYNLSAKELVPRPLPLVLPDVLGDRQITFSAQSQWLVHKSGGQALFYSLGAWLRGEPVQTRQCADASRLLAKDGRFALSHAAHDFPDAYLLHDALQPAQSVHVNLPVLSQTPHRLSRLQFIGSDWLFCSLEQSNPPLQHDFLASLGEHPLVWQPFCGFASERPSWRQWTASPWRHKIVAYGPDGPPLLMDLEQPSQPGVALLGWQADHRVQSAEYHERCRYIRFNLADEAALFYQDDRQGQLRFASLLASSQPSCNQRTFAGEMGADNMLVTTTARGNNAAFASAFDANAFVNDRLQIVSLASPHHPKVTFEHNSKTGSFARWSPQLQVLAQKVVGHGAYVWAKEGPCDRSFLHHLVHTAVPRMFSFELTNGVEFCDFLPKAQSMVLKHPSGDFFVGTLASLKQQAGMTHVALLTPRMQVQTFVEASPSGRAHQAGLGKDFACPKQLM